MPTFVPRPIRFQGIRRRDGWSLKVYSVVFGDVPLDRDGFDRALDLAFESLPEPDVASGRPGLGFFIAHQGETGDYGVVLWWNHENELPLDLWIRRTASDPWRRSEPGESICVWDLEILWQERQAWIRAMMSGGDPDGEAYLADVPAPFRGSDPEGGRDEERDDAGGDDAGSADAEDDDASGEVVATSSSPEHGIRKVNRESITLVAGHGVQGDAHFGETVQHRSRVKRDPKQPNLRQVHLVHAELFDELAAAGMPVAPGEMGENLTTRGLDLLALPRGTVLQLGSDASVEITGLRNPCAQLEALHEGLMKATTPRGEDGEIRRKAGIMAVVRTSGVVRPGDRVMVRLPDRDRVALAPV